MGTLILIKSDLESAKTQLNNLLEADRDSNEKLNISIDNFVNNSATQSKLLGQVYTSLRKYLSAVYKPILEERKQIAIDLMTNIIYANNNMSSFMGAGIDVLDTSRIDSLNSEIRRLESCISNEPKLVQLPSASSKYNNSIDSYYRQLAPLKIEVDKLNKLSGEDKKNNTSKIVPLKDRIGKYKDKTDNLAALSGETINEVPEGEADKTEEETAKTAAPQEPAAPVYYPPTGGGSPSSPVAADPVTPVTPTTPTTPTEPTTPDPIKIVQLASSLVGMTAAALAADTNNGIYSIGNYSTDSAWDIQFVNDVLRRNPDALGLLSDYYNNPDKYPYPTKSISSLLKYAMTDGTNMEYNWSSSSIDTITQYNTSKNYTPITYTEYTPKAGDVVFLNSDTPTGTFTGNTSDVSSAGRVGIVESVVTLTDETGKEKTYVTVIEGDYGTTPDTSKVARKIYEIDSKEILGYGTVKKYDATTDTSNNKNGTQNGANGPDRPITIDPRESDPDGFNKPILNPGDKTGYIDAENKETGATVDYTGTQKDSEGNVIGKVDLEKKPDNTVVVDKEDIPTVDEKGTEPTKEKEEPIDMTDYSNDNGEYFAPLDPNLVVWDWESLEEE